MSIKPLEYRKKGDIIDPEDDNIHTDNWNAQLSINKELNPDDPDVTQLLEQLESIINRMYKVKYGDYVKSELHNLFVDAWQLQKQINSELRARIKPLAYVSKLALYRTHQYVHGSVRGMKLYDNVIPLTTKTTEYASVYLSAVSPLRRSVVVNGSSYVSNVVVLKKTINISANVSYNVVKT